MLKNSTNGLAAVSNWGDDESSKNNISNRQIASWLKLINVGVGRLVGDRRTKVFSGWLCSVPASVKSATVTVS